MGKGWEKNLKIKHRVIYLSHICSKGSIIDYKIKVLKRNTNGFSLSTLIIVFRRV